MKYQYIGRTTDFKGKTLWEILGNLKNFGVGRLVVRNRFQRYTEPTFIKIRKVVVMPNPVNTVRPQYVNRFEDRKVSVLCETTFRGNKAPELMTMFKSTYKSDYQLVPKDEEHKYLNSKPTTEKRIIARTMELPPLMRELAIRSMKAKGQPVTEPRMNIAYNTVNMDLKKYRIAEEGETPTIQPVISLGKPASPELYANVKPI